MKPNWFKLWLFIVLLAGAAQAQTSNIWVVGSGKWETLGDWNNGAPSINNAGNFIWNATLPAGGGVTTVDATTAANSSVMTISNLTVAAAGRFNSSPHTLFLNNAGTNTPLQILDIFTIGAGGTLSITNSVLQVDDIENDGDVVLNSGSIIITNVLVSFGSSLLSIGVDKLGTLTMSDGALQASVITVGRNIGSAGTLTMAGGTATVGNIGIGEDAGVTGTVTGTVWLTGGQLTSAGTVTMGDYFGVGTMTVSNGTWLAGPVVIGDRGQGTLTVAGGSVTMHNAYIQLGDTTSTATGTVWVTAGQLTTTNAIIEVGREGVGHITVSNGLWLAYSVYVGTFSPAYGVYDYSSNTLAIAGGVSVISTNLTLGSTLACPAYPPYGMITVDGGSLFVTNSTHTAVLDISGGTFVLNNGTVMVDKFDMTNDCAHFIQTGGTLIYGTAVLASYRDDDGDGIPNGYEQAHGLDPLNPADASFDADGDGQSNLAEYLAGTDPTNSASSFRITSVVATGNDLQVMWTMGSGKTNALEAVNGTGYTNNFGDIFIVTNTVGNATNYLDVGGATNTPSRFYRVRLVP